MSENRVGEDWDWDAIHDVWNRINSLFDHCKTVGIPIDAVSKGALFASMQIHLIENGCDAFTTKPQMFELIRICWKYVAEHTLEVLKRVGGEVGSLEKVADADKDMFQKRVDILIQSLEALSPPTVDPEEVEKMLEAQSKLEGIVGQLVDELGGLNTIRALLVLVQQYSLVASEGNLDVAKGMMEDVQGPLWSLAARNIQNMLEEAAKKAEQEGTLN